MLTIYDISKTLQIRRKSEFTLPPLVQFDLFTSNLFTLDVNCKLTKYVD